MVNIEYYVHVILGEVGEYHARGAFIDNFYLPICTII